MNKEQTKSLSNLPNQRILLRCKGGIEIYELPSWYSTNESLSRNAESSHEDKGKFWTLLEAKNCKFHALSEDGTKVVVIIAGKGVFICDIAENGTQIPLEGNTQNVALAYFSPKQKFLVTWERWNSNVHNSSENPNLKLWNAENGKYILGWASKQTPNKLASQPKQQQTSVGQYSLLQWSADGKLMMFGGGNSQIIVYSSTRKDDEKNPFDVILKIPCPNMRLFSISPLTPTEILSNISGLLRGYLVATFVPEVKGKPGRVSLHNITQSAAGDWACKEVIYKSFFQTEECMVHWSPTGDAMLCVTQMTVDRTGQSYYGSSNVYLFTGKNAIQVSLPNYKDNEVGIVHDIAWNPKKSKNPSFALVSGKMPAMTSLHNGYTAQPLFLFGKNHRNTIVWAPHGRFVCIGGFGNLAGNFEFWDKNKGKRIPRLHGDISQPVRGSSVPIGYTFSADSRMFLISTTSPRMNVENGIQLFRYNGDGPIELPLIDKSRYLPDQLYYAEFVPALNTDVYPDRPQSPIAKRTEDKNDVNSIQATEPEASKSIKSGRYIPPAMRNRNSGTFSNSLAERMRREREGEMGGPTKVTNTHGRKGIPGMAPVSNKKTIPGMAPVKNNQNNKSRNKKKKQQQPVVNEQKKEEKHIVEEANKEPAPDPPVAEQQDPEKRAKKIKKLLKQIDELKKSNKELNEDQKKKIASYHSLCEELKTLGV